MSNIQEGWRVLEKEILEMDRSPINRNVVFNALKTERKRVENNLKDHILKIVNECKNSGGVYMANKLNSTIGRYLDQIDELDEQLKVFNTE